MILVTGSTGTIGSELLKQLSQRGVPVRAMVRNLDKVSVQQMPGIEWVQGDFSDRASIARAMQGIDRAFLLAPGVPDLHLVESEFIDIAVEAKVKHIVNISAVGAQVGAAHRFGDWHGRTEQNLKKSGLVYTILRPNFFMQNLIGLAGMIQGGTIYVPAGTGKAPFVDIRDIAAVAAACLTESGHENRIYEVTGPQAIGYTDIAAALTKVLSKQVNYVDVPIDAAAKSMVESGMPSWLADAFNELNTGLKENRFSTISDAVMQITKRAPITIEQFIRDHQSVFVA
jgi:uncharacterized protein YbjT (DUF2867 family)